MRPCLIDATYIAGGNGSLFHPLEYNLTLRTFQASSFGYLIIQLHMNALEYEISNCAFAKKLSSVLPFFRKPEILPNSNPNSSVLLHILRMFTNTT